MPSLVLPHTNGDRSAPPALTFRVSSDNGRLQVRPPAPPRAKKRRRRKPIVLAVRGSVTVKAYKTKWRDPARRKTYRAWTIFWKDLKGRHLEKRADLARAKSRAEEIATDLCNSGADMLAFTPADKASYQRSIQNLVPIGSPPLESATADYARGMQILPPGWTFAQACEYCRQHAPQISDPQKVPELVQSLLAEKEKSGAGQKWLGTLRQQLERFADKFDCPVHILRGHEITAWLNSLGVGLRSRKNYRAAIAELVRFARARGQLAETWDELRHVQKIKPPPIEVGTYTPEQFLKLLIARLKVEEGGRAGDTLMPFLLLAGFAGVRHEEMTDRNGTAVLDWSNIKLHRGFVKVPKNVSKNKEDRLIHIHPNLAAWLRPYARPSGPVCELGNASAALTRTKRAAGLPSGRGELTNALRASFISYRMAETNNEGLVAREAGNSPQIIRKHYLEVVEPEQAQRWFALHPSAADILPLFAWAQASA